VTTTWTPISISGDGGTTRVPEDILKADNPASPLVKRGRLLWRGDAERGFPGLAQHYSGAPRPVATPNGRSGALEVLAVGQESDGYGSADDGSGLFLRLSRDVEAGAVVTVSGRLTPMFQDVGTQTQGSVTFTTPSVDQISFFLDTQAWDDSDRGFMRWYWAAKSGQWPIGGDDTTYPGPAGGSSPPVPIPGAQWQLGGNQNKESSFYFAYSAVLNTTAPVAVPWEPANAGQPGVGMGGYGHFQIAGQVYDLRGLGAGYKRHTPQSGDIGNSFRGGMNPGVGFSTPYAGLWAGIGLERMEVTVGDVLA
jgi:hypothetical protein